jgi:hypothetical protein
MTNSGVKILAAFLGVIFTLKVISVSLSFAIDGFKNKEFSALCEQIESQENCASDIEKSGAKKVSIKGSSFIEEALSFEKDPNYISRSLRHENKLIQLCFPPVLTQPPNLA